MADILIKKADGTQEPFKADKLRHSLRRSRADDEEINTVVSAVERELKDGMTTEEIYRNAFDTLRQMRRETAARYSLRRALAELGPSGFPFEVFVAEVHRALGHSAKVGTMVSGKCVEYEIDVIAKDEESKKVIFSEAKFHNASRTKTDLQVALYSKARFDDISNNDYDGHVPKDFSAEPWIITNTKFTSNARKYGACANIMMVGWNYPREGNLQDLVEKAQLEPVTALTTLSGAQKKNLIDEGVVLCRDVHKNRDALEKAGVHGPVVGEVLEEVEKLCTIS